MIPFIDYILKVNALLIVVFGFYYFFLRKETFFSAIRFYFLIGILGSLLLPLIKSKKVIYVQLQENRTFDQQFLLSINEEVSLSWWKQITPIEWLSYILLVSMLIMLMIFVYKFYKLLSHIKQLTITKYEEQKIKIDYMSKEAYSFWNWIVLPCNFKQIDNYKLIILHEKIHVVQKHSIDLLLINVVKSVFWFNPFLRFLERAIKLNLEYIVDEKVVSQQNSYDYQLTLVQFQQQTHSNKLVSSFGTSDLKKRIIKINQPKSKNMKRLKFLCIAPIIGCFFYLFQVEVNAKIVPNDPVITVLDTLQISTVNEITKSLNSANTEVDMSKEEILVERKETLNDNKAVAEQRQEPITLIKANNGFKTYQINMKDAVYVVDGEEVADSERINKIYFSNGPIKIYSGANDTLVKTYGNKAKEGVIVINTASSIQDKKDKVDQKLTTNLFVLDGKEVEESSLKNIKPNTIEQMNILKGKEAVEKYGVKGEKGVIEIITKN